MSIVISVENLSKSYQLGQIGTGTFTHDLNIWWAKMRGKSNPMLRIGEKDHGNRDGEELWALKDVSFKVEQGEVLGIIGRNGAGKSTLLKILSRVTAPTSGKIKVKGRIASLLEVGTGFHPELSGRENIYLNGAILGMNHKEIDSKFDEIVEFAEVEKFIDTPVKRYSSGMYVRLAFAVAAHLEPEILVVDEVLAVGDTEFQKKCLGKMGAVAQEGRTVLFVSHNIAAITSLCSRVICLSQGWLVGDGFPDDVITQYVAVGSNQTVTLLKDRLDRAGNSEVILTSVQYVLDDMVTDTLVCGRDAVIDVEYESKITSPLGKLSISINLLTADGQNVVCFWNRLLGADEQNCPSKGKWRCLIPKFPLMPGNYSLLLSLSHNNNLADKITGAASLYVIEGDYFGTGRLPPKHLADVLVDHSWTLTEA